jgi:hypothetical protein
MKVRKRTILSTVVALIASAGFALAGGYWSQLPIVGVPANTACQSYGNNGVCNQYNPAGPAEDLGSWTVPADTGYVNGQNPQTVTVPATLLGPLNAKVNRLVGGDFGTNLWQRGTTFTALTPSSAVLTADRWAVYSSTNTVTVTKQTGTADTIPASGFYASMRVSRPSTTTTTAICVGQVLDKQATSALINNNGVFSFYALAGAGLSAVTGSTNNITATIAYYTAADSATPGTNTGTFMAGTITGYTAVTTQGGAILSAPNIATNTATIASGVATQPISTTWTRYSFWGKIPSTDASGTAVTGAGVTICYTPTSGTGGSTEWFEFTGAQLQAMPATVTTQLPFGVTAPTGFERRYAQEEADYQLYYTTAVTETAASISVTPSGQGASTTTCVLSIPFGTQMREVPTFAAAGTALSATTWTVTHVVTNTALSTPFLAATTGGSTTSMGNLTATVASGLTAGQTCTLTGAGGGSILVFSAEP